MMVIFIAIISIFLVTSLLRMFNRVLPFKICPICAGVSLTWLWIVAGITVGLLEPETWKLTAAIAMGGTAVGLAYQGERRYPEFAKNIFRFRVPVIIAGFLFFYWAINNIGWLSFGTEVLVLAVVTYTYFILPAMKIKNTTDPQKVVELEKRLEECCG